MPSLGLHLNSGWTHYAAWSAIILAIVAGLLRNFVLERTDPLHCNALLSNGRWLSEAAKIWQPEGCMLHQYESGDSTQCLGESALVFAGDSVTRKLFFQVAHLVDPALPTAPVDDGSKHSNHYLTSANGTVFEFHWDPFLNTTQDLLNSTTTYRPSGQPPLLVLGSGLWYLRYSDSSGGLPAWESNLESIFDSVARHPLGIADKIVILPVEDVVTSKLSPERADTMRASDIDAMNSDLRHRLSPSISHSRGLIPSTQTQIYLPRVFNLLLNPFEADDGLHYPDSIVAVQANILINFLCNDKLDKQVPFDKTCCRSYPWPVPAQLAILLTVVVFAPVTLLFMRLAGAHPWTTPSAIANMFPSLIFSAVLALGFLADRTSLWEKEQKYFDPWSFVALGLISITVGLWTVKRSENDLGFLNREQTDEWKGWMQVMILIYHYTGASKISGIYNPIRVLVASYLFMTGYGHTSFYLRKAEFGFVRIAQVLIRLNMLTLLLTYTMGTDYIFYYFTPLVTFWYLVIHVTMVLGARYNVHVSFLVGKIVLSAAFSTWFIHETWLLVAGFSLLEHVFNIHWSAREASFRLSLDSWIVYIGMLTSIIAAKCREHRLADNPHWSLAVKFAVALSIITIIWFFVFELAEESKFTYNRWHPHISALPVLSFMILRNANAVMRSATSKAFAFVGRCSLEAFVLQYHLWLAADAKGLLIVLPGSRWRSLNFILVSVIFFYVCNEAARATAEVTARICAADPQQLPQPVTSASQAEHSSEAIPLMASHDETPLELQISASPHRFSRQMVVNIRRVWSQGLKVRLAIFLAGAWLLNLTY